MPSTPEDAKAWLIQYFRIPADATITQFATSGSPVYGAYISWQVTVNGQRHTYCRAYDFQKQGHYSATRFLSGASRMTRLLIASLIALAGCSSTPVAKQSPVTPLPTPAQVAKANPAPQRPETLITSDPGGLRIEVGNSYVGTTPVALDLAPYFGPNSPGITITATSEMGEVKTKFLPPWEPLPQEIVFQMDWPRLIPGTEVPIRPSGHN
jgi:hypothetical protein